MTDDVPAPTEGMFLARANLSLQGQAIHVYDVVELALPDPEVAACVAMETLVPADPDGTFPDLGPVDRMPTAIYGCCGNAAPRR